MAPSYGIKDYHKFPHYCKFEATIIPSKWLKGHKTSNYYNIKKFPRLQKSPEIIFWGFLSIKSHKIIYETNFIYYHIYFWFRGCDGQRTYFNGCSSITLNGNIVGRTAQYGIEEVEVATATLDLEDIRSYRNSVRSRNLKASHAPSYPRIDVSGFGLSRPGDVSVPNSKIIEWAYHR